ncbi:hypothetical protein L596_010672 [Steinernema carpocapsae]|uniref:Uncharacterized protein n=1 Tax=Steinernema carpocapsae TaxID=34508 RepID=A0A4U5PJ64_STECR|nr:hypothetical protein L596_010672 [Steinernema carpocapsae]
MRIKRSCLFTTFWTNLMITRSFHLILQMLQYRPQKSSYQNSRKWSNTSTSKCQKTILHCFSWFWSCS